MKKEKKIKVNKKNKENVKTASKVLVKKRRMILICSILVILLLCIGLYFIFLTPNKNNSNNSNKGQTDYNTDSSKIVRITNTNGTEFDPYNLIYSLNLNTLPEEYFGYFFQGNSVNANELENKVKIFLAIRKLIAEDEEKYGDETKEIYISAEVVEKSLEMIFGKDISYTHESLGGNSCTFTGFSYDNDKKEYVQKPSDDCKMGQDLMIYTEQSEISATDQTLEVPMNIVFVETLINPESTDISYNYYQDINKQTLLTTNNQYNVDAIRNQLQNYKFVFNIVDGIHQFSAVERVK